MSTKNSTISSTSKGAKKVVNQLSTNEKRIICFETTSIKKIKSRSFCSFKFAMFLYSKFMINYCFFFTKFNFFIKRCWRVNNFYCSKYAFLIFAFKRFRFFFKRFHRKVFNEVKSQRTPLRIHFAHLSSLLKTMHLFSNFVQFLHERMTTMTLLNFFKQLIRCWENSKDIRQKSLRTRVSRKGDNVTSLFKYDKYAQLSTLRNTSNSLSQGL